MIQKKFLNSPVYPDQLFASIAFVMDSSISMNDSSNPSFLMIFLTMPKKLEKSFLSVWLREYRLSYSLIIKNQALIPVSIQSLLSFFLQYGIEGTHL